MGKSGYLPDISGEFKYFKTYALNEFKQGNYNGAYAGLVNLNRCLGEEYNVIVSNTLYEKESNVSQVYLCNFCYQEEKKVINQGEEDEYIKTIEVPRRIPITQVLVYDQKLSYLDCILNKGDSRKAWDCSFCGNINLIENTTQIIPKRQQPYSLKVVPECPVKLNGIRDRVTFRAEFSRWFHLFLEEISSQEVLYRTEWKAQNEGEEMTAYKDKGDLE